MSTIRRGISLLACVSALLLAACAVSPESESQREAVEADISAILSQPVARDLGESRRCLSDNEYDSFRALDEQHILFEGLRDRQWITTLRNRCPDLRYGDSLVVKQFSGSRMCDGDQFYVTDWFDWPWYHRAPWHWGPSWSSGMQCTLGAFQPVTADQVAEIEAALDRR